MGKTESDDGSPEDVRLRVRAGHFSAARTRSTRAVIMPVCGHDTLPLESTWLSLHKKNSRHEEHVFGGIIGLSLSVGVRDGREQPDPRYPVHFVGVGLRMSCDYLALWSLTAGTREGAARDNHTPATNARRRTAYLLFPLLLLEELEQ